MTNNMSPNKDRPSALPSTLDAISTVSNRSFTNLVSDRLPRLMKLGRGLLWRLSTFLVPRGRAQEACAHAVDDQAADPALPEPDLDVYCDLANGIIEAVVGRGDSVTAHVGSLLDSVCREWDEDKVCVLLHTAQRCAMLNIHELTSNEGEPVDEADVDRAEAYLDLWETLDWLAIRLALDAVEWDGSLAQVHVGDNTLH